AATTSICLFLNSPNIPPFLLSLLCNMTASEPNSFLICCIASGIDFAKYFFIFMLHSPPQHFAPVHLDPIHYKTKRQLDRKSTRLNSSHVSISYAVFCLKKKIIHTLHFFSFHRLLHYLYLHSFPTRRSSDLFVI